jgi:hypothetical protein
LIERKRDRSNIDRDLKITSIYSDYLKEKIDDAEMIDLLTKLVPEFDVKQEEEE